MTSAVVGPGTTGVPRAPRGDRLTDLKYRVPARLLACWGALVVLVVVAVVMAPASLGGRSIWVVSALAGVLGLASFGQMLIVMIGAIDLSVPSIIAISAGIVVQYGTEGSNTAAVIAVAVLAAALVSLVNGVLISVLRLNAMIVTLATFGIVNGAIILWTGVSFSVTGRAPAALQRWATREVFNISACFIAAVVVGVVLSAVLWRTRAGRRVAEVGSNRRAARALGVRVQLVELCTFAAAGLLYGVAGVLLAGFVGTPDITVGAPYQIATVTAVAIAGVAFTGGPASVATVLGACLFLQLLDQFLAILGLSGGARTVVQGVALVTAVAALTLGGYGVSGFRRIQRLLTPLRHRG
jgi:ribose transport system permease protein